MMSRSPELVASRRAQSPVFGLFLLVLVAAGARILWWAIAGSAMSFDLLAWHSIVLEIAKGANPYATTHWLNYPPFWYEVLFLIQRITANMAVETDFDSIRVVLIVGDLALFVAIWQLLRVLEPGVSCNRLLLWGYCLNPVLILLTVQHGNFDAIPIFWDVLFLQFLIRYRRGSQAVDWLIAAACLGLAIYTKTFSAILWPLLVPGARGLPWRTRIMGALPGAGPTAISLAPLYVLDPEAITRNVLAYHSVGNTFGIVGALRLAFPRFDLELYSRVFAMMLAGGSIGAALLLWKRDLRRDADMVLVAAMVFLSLFTLGPGYGTQYWFWVLPLLLVCYRQADARFRGLIAVFGTIVICTIVFEYAFEITLGRFLYCWLPTPWVGAVSDYFPYPSTHVILLRVPMSMASIVFLFFGFADLFRRESPPERLVSDAPAKNI